MAMPANGIRHRSDSPPTASTVPTPALRQVPSPNYGPRRDGLRPRLIVLHYTAMRSAVAAIERLCDAKAEVSAHYLIDAGGQITQLVAEEARAWHAGDGEWQGLDDINSRSIGIELDNRGTHPFCEPQMVALEDLMRGIMARWNISADGVIGHSDAAPGRKVDPGARFDWARLAHQGLARAPTKAPHDVTLSEEAFLQAAQAAGFTADASFEAILHATRLRFAPWRQGPLCIEDFAL